MPAAARQSHSAAEPQPKFWLRIKLITQIRLRESTPQMAQMHADLGKSTALIGAVWGAEVTVRRL